MGATLMFAVYIPGADRDVDPEMSADELTHMINEVRKRTCELAGQPDYFEPIEVSALPAPRWVTAETLRELRAFVESRGAVSVPQVTPEQVKRARGAVAFLRFAVAPIDSVMKEQAYQDVLTILDAVASGQSPTGEAHDGG